MIPDLMNGVCRKILLNNMTIIASFVIKGGQFNLNQIISPSPILPGRKYYLSIHSAAFENLPKPCDKVIVISCKNIRALYTQTDDDTIIENLPLQMLFYKTAFGPSNIFYFMPLKFEITNLKNALDFDIKVFRDREHKILSRARITLHVSIGLLCE